MREFLHKELTGRILGAAFEVHRTLGPGFLEYVYEEALARELVRQKISFQQQLEIPILYKGDKVGTHRLDLLVEDQVVVELKAVKELADVHSASLLSYLGAANLTIGLLLNCAQPRLEYKPIARKQGLG